MNYKNLIYFIKGHNLNRRQIKYFDMLFKYNIKIIYRSKSQNFKIDVFIQIIEYKFIDFTNERIK